MSLVRDEDAEFGILISDIVMPNPSGFEVATAIRTKCLDVRDDENSQVHRYMLIFQGYGIVFHGALLI